MMLSNCFKNFSTGGSYISRLHVSPRSLTLQPFSSKRCYSDKKEKNYFEELEAFGAEEESKLKDVKEFPIIENKDEVSRYKAHLSENYKEFYDAIAGPGKSWREQYPREFQKLTPQKQAGVKELGKLRSDAMYHVIEKYGAHAGPGIARLDAYTEQFKTEKRPTVRVAVTGAAGAIGYAIAYRIASGGIFGPRTPVILQLLELPQAMNSLKGVEMELLDCAFPTLEGITISDSPDKAFDGVDYALLIGAQPRTKGMERGDLLLKNAEIFATQGKALNKVGKRAGTKVYVVGNPANTNALIASHNAPSIPEKNFIAMTRLDHNRGLAQIAAKTGSTLSDISRFVIWGNHSATQYPDVTHAFVKDKLATDLLPHEWVEKTFIPAVQQRGAEIIKALGSSSAASAASAAIEGIHDWHWGTAAEWTSAAVHSSGEYGVTPGLFYSYPVVFNNEREWDIVKNLPITNFSAQRMEDTHKELLQERDGVAKYLK